MTAVRSGASGWRDWLELARPFSWVASVVPVVVGAAVAWPTGRLAAGLLPLLVLGVLLAQSGTNMINEVFDVRRGVDTLADGHASKVLVQQRLPIDAARKGGIAVLGLAVVVALIVALVRGRGPLPAILGVVGVLVGYAYTAPPFELKYRGLGLPLVVVAMGPLMVLGSGYVLSGRWTAASAAASLPVGLLVGAILLANDLRDLRGDRAAGIRTTAVVLGPKTGWRLYVGLIAGAYAALSLAVISGTLPWPALVALASLPVAVLTLTSAQRPAAGPGRAGPLSRLDAETAAVELLFGLLLAVGLGVAHLVR